MNAERILEVIGKGFTLLEALRQTAEAASPAIKALYELMEKQKDGATITAEELARVEGILDAQLAAFNEPLPED